jgi:hypothetical protein
MSNPKLRSVLGPLSSALLTDADLQGALRRIARAGSMLLPNCARASVTLVETGLASTVTATNETALMLDESQYELTTARA